MLGTGRVIESFVVESWLEHERQHARVTNADRIDQETLNAFQIGEGPVVRHLLRPGYVPMNESAQSSRRDAAAGTV